MNNIRSYLMLIFVSFFWLSLLSAQTESLSVKDRFIRDTGFVGKVTQDPFGYQIHMLWGYFPDIKMPDKKDSTQLRNFCEAVISKMLPYILALRHQLEVTSFSPDGVVYRQKVNGYIAERGSALEFRSFDKDRVMIVNSTVPISDSLVDVRMTKEVAITTAYADWKTTQYFKPELLIENIGAGLCYSRDYQIHDKLHYSLQWVVTLPGYTYYYDASDSRLNKRNWNMGDLIGFYQ